MSQEDLENLRSAYEAFNEGRIEELLPLLDPEIEVETAPELPDRGVYRGPDGFIEALKRSREPFEKVRVEVEDLIEAGDAAVALVKIEGRGRGSDVPVDIRVAHVWELRDGKAVRFRVFLDRSQALAAVGVEREP